MMAITGTYMVEPRYLVSGILPLAGLGGLGLSALLKRCQSNWWKGFAVGGVFVFGTVLNSGVVNLMPYELDRPALLGAVEKIRGINSEAPILVPWAYSDYHFLHLMLPGTKIFNVNTPTRNGQMVPLNKAWNARLTWWYKSFYIDNSENLASRLDGQVAYYLGWKRYPPAENVQKLANRLGLAYVARLISQMSLKNHLKESWLWYSPDFELTFVGQSGQYEFYRVNLVDGFNSQPLGKRS